MATTGTHIDLLENTFQGDEKTTEALSSVLELLKELEVEWDEKLLSYASATVWIASRDEAWRTPLGESGVLEFFQSLIPKATEPTLMLNSLKIVGNACAEKEVNRKRVIEHPLSVSSVVNALNDCETRVVAAVVLLNICTDYEPSQLAAIEKGACSTIFSILADKNFNDDLDYFLRILEMLLSHDTGKTATPEAALETLLEYLKQGGEGFDNTLSLVSILSSLLTTERFQKLALKEVGLFSRVLDIVEKTYGLAVDAKREAKDKSLIAYARNQLVEAIGEIATDTGFLEVNPLQGEVMSRVSKWLEVEPGKEELVVTACLVYGNVGRSDDVCLKLVETAVHVPLLKVIQDTAVKFEKSVKQVRQKKIEAEEAIKEGGVEVGKLPTGAMSVGIIHAAVGVLKNLAIPPENKKALVDAGSFKAIRHMLSMEGVGVGQIWYSAVSLGRLAIVNTLENARQFLALGEGEIETLLELFLKRYKEVEELPVKTEISRTIAALLRIIYRDEEPDIELLKSLLSHPTDVEESLWDMVKQDKYPVVRSEGWFALALLSREAQGATRVVRGLETELVRKTLMEGGRKDRDNVGVLVIEMRKNATEKKDVTNELMGIFFAQQGAPVFEVVGQVSGHVEGEVEADVETKVEGKVVTVGLEKNVDGGLARV